MRLRNIKGASEAMLKSPFVVQDYAQMRGRWAEYFKNSNPIHVELGMGKGKFITTLADRKSVV